jgi:hypothetical protein
MENGTMIIPGHGRVSDVADLDIYHQMVTIVRDRLQDMIKRGMTLEQVKGREAHAGLRPDLRSRHGQLDD